MASGRELSTRKTKSYDQRVGNFSYVPDLWQGKGSRDYFQSPVTKGDHSLNDHAYVIEPP